MKAAIMGHDPALPAQVVGAEIGRLACRFESHAGTLDAGSWRIVQTSYPNSL